MTKSLKLSALLSGLLCFIFFTFTATSCGDQAKKKGKDFVDKPPITIGQPPKGKRIPPIGVDKDGNFMYVHQRNGKNGILYRVSQDQNKPRLTLDQLKELDPNAFDVKEGIILPTSRKDTSDYAHYKWHVGTFTSISVQNGYNLGIITTVDNIALPIALGTPHKDFIEAEVLGSNTATLNFHFMLQSSTNPGGLFSTISSSSIATDPGHHASETYFAVRYTDNNGTRDFPIVSSVTNRTMMHQHNNTQLGGTLHH